jgi:hypothetical protein
MPTLYKYLPAAGIVSLLRNRQFWFRCPLQFEPLDCRADLLENFDLDEARRVYRHELERLLCDATPPPAPYHRDGLRLQSLRTREPPWTPAGVETEFGDLTDDSFKGLDEQRDRIGKEQEQILQDIRVLCLCENSASAPMWLQYADEGRGGCIGFRYVPEVDNVLGAAQKVQYVDEWPNIATPLEWARHALYLDEIPFGKRAREALYLKKKKFADEQEWRIIAKPNPGTRADSEGVYRVIIDPPEIAEIILGPKLDPEDESDIRAESNKFCPHAAIRKSDV